MPSEQVREILRKKGYTDDQMEAYSLLRQRGYTHEDIMTRIKTQARSVIEPEDEQIAPSDRISGAGRKIPKRTIPEKILETVTEPQTAGGIAGGITGGIIGAGAAGIGAVPGAIIGAGIGGAGGKAYQKVTEPEEEIGLREIPLAAVEEAGYEALGGGIAKVGGKILRPFARRVTDEAKVAMKTLDKYMPKAKGVFSHLFEKRVPAILPAEATENRVLDLLQNIAEYSLVGGKKIADYKKIQRAGAISDMVDDLVQTFGKQADPDLLGDAIRLTIQKKLKGSRVITGPMYNAVEEAAENVYVPTAEIKEFVEPIVRMAEAVKGLQSEAAGYNLAATISELNENVTFPVAKELRSRLLSVVNEFSIKNRKAPAIGKAKRIITLLDDAMEDSLKSQNPEAYNLWREANRLYKEGSQKYDNYFLRRLLKQADPDFGGEPERVLKQIFKEGGVSNIRRLKNAIGIQTPVWRQMKSWHITTLIKKATSKDGVIQGKSLLNNISRMTEKANREIFEPYELRALKNVATTLKVIQERQAEGTGRMLIQLTQGGAALTLLGAGGGRPGAAAGAGAIIFGPAVLSRMLTNPMIAQWLTRGFRMPTASRHAIALAARLSRAAEKIEQEIEEERSEEEPIEESPK